MDNYATHYLKHVGRVESVGFSTLKLSNITYLSYHPMLQVWYNPWIKESLSHSKFNIRSSFWNGFSLRLILLVLTKLEDNNA